MTLLRVEGLNKAFNGVQAVDGGEGRTGYVPASPVVSALLGEYAAAGIIYRPVKLDGDYDVYREPTTRPDLSSHSFRAVAGYPVTDRLLILRRVRLELPL